MRPRCHRVWPVALLVLLLVSPTPLGAKGTHWLLEGGGGFGLTDDTSQVRFFDASFAYGGKFRGNPLRFYLLVNYSGGDYQMDGRSFSRRVTDHLLLAGPRIYIPISRNMRFFGQALFGSFWATADWTINGLEHYRPEDQGLGAKFGLGFQARVARWLSLGLVYDRLVFWGKENDLAVPALTGLDTYVETGDQNRFGAMAALHF